MSVQSRFRTRIFLTNIYKHAQERAQAKVDDEGGAVTVMEYDFDLDEIVTANPNLKVKRFSAVSEDWARFVMFNRLRKETAKARAYFIISENLKDTLLTYNLPDSLYEFPLGFFGYENHSYRF
jgi:hypothetical protein